MSVSETAYLSARVPMELKNEFKSLAARRGLKVQDLLRQLVADYLDHEVTAAPRLGPVLNALHGHRAELQAKGVTRLVLFGSVARGDARPDSDIDMAVELEGGKAPSLIRLGRLSETIEGVLGGTYKVDLVPLDKMRATVAESAQRDAIEVFG